MRALLAGIFLLWCGCGTRFVEPNPPRLVRVSQQFTPAAELEPTVYVLLWDVHLSTAEDCARARENWAARLRNLLHTGSDARELPAVELAPGCQQPFERRVDLQAFEAALREAELAYSPRTVRPIVLYLNNVDLPLPAGLAADLKDVLAGAVARGAPVPFLWAFAAPAVREQLDLPTEVDWTHVADPGLSDELARLARSTVPLVTRRATSLEPRPLLLPEQLARTQMLKSCGWDARAQAFHFRADGRAQPVSPDKPPAFRVALAEAVAVPQAELGVETIALELEVCEGYCDRATEGTTGQWIRWTEQGRCFLPAPKPKADPPGGSS